MIDEEIEHFVDELHLRELQPQPRRDNLFQHIAEVRHEFIVGRVVGVGIAEKCVVTGHKPNPCRDRSIRKSIAEKFGPSMALPVDLMKGHEDVIPLVDSQIRGPRCARPPQAARL